MLQSAKWIALSVAVHLAVATGLFFWGLRDDKQTEQIIMVVIDNPPSTGVLLHKASQAAPRTVAAPAVRGRPQKPKRLKVLQQVGLPASIHAPPLDAVPQQNRTVVPLKLPAELHAAAPMHQKSEIVDVAMKPLPQRSAQQGSIKQGAIIEDVQQRYRQEHLIHIRELITRRLVYPPLARRMNWSGKVVLAFTIAEDGSASAIRITETSGFTVLDKSAIETIRRVAPFPKPPVRTEIVVPINFRMMQ